MALGKIALRTKRRMPKYASQWLPDINHGASVVFLRCFAFTRGGSRKQNDCTHILVGFEPTSLAFGFRLIDLSAQKKRKPSNVEEMIAKANVAWRARRTARETREVKFRFQIALGRAVKPVLKAVGRLSAENRRIASLDRPTIVGVCFASRYRLPRESPLEQALKKEGLTLLNGVHMPNGASIVHLADAFMEHFQDQLDIFMKGFIGNSLSVERELSRISTGETRLARRRLKALR